MKQISEEEWRKIQEERLQFTQPPPADSRLFAIADRLPPVNVPVLVRCRSYDSDYQEGWEIARYQTGGKGPHFVIGKQEEEAMYVTHWMPLPSAPTNATDLVSRLRREVRL